MTVEEQFSTLTDHVEKECGEIARKLIARNNTYVEAEEDLIENFEHGELHLLIDQIIENIAMNQATK